ncbi:MAG TPA: 3'(2'),5'-bisphosphate nucleotidase CysQ [Chitinophagales bacterium]|nr:3'(2'),5'-bisphosphate nucleotidase CysQ [Chitinophagales bacterium]
MLDKVDIQKILFIAKGAGKAILDVYYQPFDAEKKSDHSPITLADKHSNDFITQSLKDAYPEIPILSEESKQIPFEERKHWNYFWLVDPLDGTKEFIGRNGEFTVNIALIEDNQPIMGVVHIPVNGITYYASKNSGSIKILSDGRIKKLSNKYLHYTTRKNVVVIGSRSHPAPETERFVEELRQQGKAVDFISAGSSLKFCLVAEGTADVYPRFGPTMEWDTAAAHVIATEAGRKVLNVNTREPLVYNKEDLTNPWFVVE